MLGKRNTSSKIDDTVAKSVNFELTIADIARRSERRAWWITASAVGMSLILTGGYFFMLPLKEKVPYLVMADAYTGTSTVARLTDDATLHNITASEAINRSNIAHFVLARESYDVALMNLRDWTTVITMSSPNVAAAYTSLYADNNPNSPYKLFGREKAIRIKLLSIVLLAGAPGVPPKGATVRFQRSLYDKQSGVSQPMDSKIATLDFTYKSNLKMDEKYRIENPLGFQVTSYRVDTDYATSAPGEVQGQPLPVAATTPATPPDANAQPPGIDNVSQQPNLAAPPMAEHETTQPGAAPRASSQGAGRP